MFKVGDFVEINNLVVREYNLYAKTPIEPSGKGIVKEIKFSKVLGCDIFVVKTPTFTEAYFVDMISPCETPVKRWRK